MSLEISIRIEVYLYKAASRCFHCYTERLLYFKKSKNHGSHGVKYVCTLHGTGIWCPQIHCL